MNAVKIAAIVLILAGVPGLAYGSLSFTKETHEAKLGPIELSIKEKQTVNVPVWALWGDGDRRCAPVFWKQEEPSAAPVAV